MAKFSSLFVCAAVCLFALSSQAAASASSPLLVEELQDIHKTQGDSGNFDGEIVEGVALDIRRDAQKQAALSYGARGGLSMRNFEIVKRLERYEDVLNRVFDFRRLLIQAPSGFLIEPPIISEAENALIIEDQGIEAAVSDKAYFMGANAKIVTAPRNWRTYLYHDWHDVPPPPKILWPQNKDEQAEWNGWVRKGWDEGYNQGDDMFEANLNRLVADFNGMIRYRVLLSQGMVSKPFALQEDRGVTGDGREMRVGDRAIRITGPSQFQVDSGRWQPADR